MRLDLRFAHHYRTRAFMTSFIFIIIGYALLNMSAVIFFISETETTDRN